MVSTSTSEYTRVYAEKAYLKFYPDKQLQCMQYVPVISAIPQFPLDSSATLYFKHSIPSHRLLRRPSLHRLDGQGCLMCKKRLAGLRCRGPKTPAVCTGKKGRAKTSPENPTL